MRREERDMTRAERLRRIRSRTDGYGFASVDDVRWLSREVSRLDRENAELQQAVERDWSDYVEALP